MTPSLASRWIAALAVLLLFGAGLPRGFGQSEPAAGGAAASVVDSSRAVVVVEGEAITEGDVEFLMLSRRVPAELQKQVRPTIVEQLIERRLMRAYLADRKAEANAEAVASQVAAMRRILADNGDDPAEVLKRLGYTEERLRDTLSLPLAWRVHVNRVVTDERLREYWQEHREEFDGTQVRASQILLRLPKEAEEDAVQEATRRLSAVREGIVAGRLTFAEAAESHSEAPSRDAGGDVGFFAYRGTMPSAFSEAVFRLKTGEVSEPFRTPYGMHLATVTERKPGELSLEDARQRVLNHLAGELWDKIVAQRRLNATIEWAGGKTSRSRVPLK